MSATEVVKSISIANLANQREAVMERVAQALDLLRDAEQIANAAHLGFPRLVIDDAYAVRGRPTVSGEHAKRDEARDSIRRVIDVKGWSYLLAESGLRTFMDKKARAQWDEQLSSGEVPELTAGNIEATFTQIHSARGEMFERGVIECFRRLSWDYKTNQPFKFGKKIILRFLVDTYGNTNHRTADELDDLNRVFCVVEGKPEPDHRNAVYYLMGTARRERKTEAENEYFAVKWFKNGNGHVTFKRPELVTKLNQILARHYPNALASEAR